jgi:hypothetical protein
LGGPSERRLASLHCKIELGASDDVEFRIDVSHFHPGVNTDIEVELNDSDL